MAPLNTPGIHHVTAIAADPQRNLDFYTTVLGLRLVKRTVNFDDPGTYHFYFGDEHGTPGSLLTFFPWPGAFPGLMGTGQVSSIVFAVAPDAFTNWSRRLEEFGVGVQREERFGEPVLRFRDPDGLWLEIAGSSGNASEANAVGAGDRLLGFHSATLLEAASDDTIALLETMGYQRKAADGNRVRFDAGFGRAAILDVVTDEEAPENQLGAGTVHHIAFRARDDEQQLAWRGDLVAQRYRVTPVIDRIYFHSIYFREPGGVLFEIATDPPGFALDEASEHLGEKLMLPPWLEPQRDAIEATLPPVTLTQPAGRHS